MGNVVLLEATSLGDAWFQAVDKIISKGRDYHITKGSFEGTRRLGMTIIIDISHPETRPLAPIMPEASNIKPPTDEEDIQNYLAYLMTPEVQPNEHYSYGEDLYWQIEWIIKYYKKNGFGTNHCYMTVGRPETVLFYDREVDYTEVIVVRERKPNNMGKIILGRAITNAWNEDQSIKTSSQCLRGIDVWIDDGKLKFWVYFRSWDLWGGFPVNLGGIQLLKEYMASEIGVEDGPMIVSSKDLHIYEYAKVIALMRLGKYVKMEV